MRDPTEVGGGGRRGGVEGDGGGRGKVGVKLTHLWWEVIGYKSDKIKNKQTKLF